MCPKGGQALFPSSASRPAQHPMRLLHSISSMLLIQIVNIIRSSQGITRLTQQRPRDGSDHLPLSVQGLSLSSMPVHKSPNVALERSRVPITDDTCSRSVLSGIPATRPSTMGMGEADDIVNTEIYYFRSIRLGAHVALNTNYI